MCSRRCFSHVLIQKMIKTRKRKAVEEGDPVGNVLARVLREAGLEKTVTSKGWCLRQGLRHIFSIDSSGTLLQLFEQHGPPLFYFSPLKIKNENQCNLEPKNCFQSLCRIVAGQQLAGSAAHTVWKRLLETTKYDLNPRSVIELASPSSLNLELNLQKPAGLSKAKANCILALSVAFHENVLTETYLKGTDDEPMVRSKLLSVKGIGNWSCDMFLMFSLHHSNVLPFGDLGVRKGIAKFLDLKGKGKNGSLCQKRDFERVSTLLQPYEPFLALVTFYMWKLADTMDFYHNKKIKEKGDTT